MNKINEIKFGFDHYLQSGNDYYFGRPSKKQKKLPPGIYQIQTNEGQLYLSGMSAITDTLIRLPSFTSESVIKEVEKFWSDETKSRFEKRKLVYKRGIILHGIPGVGKSACISQIMEAEVKAGGIVIFGPNPRLLYEAINYVREIQKEENIRCLVVWEEFDELIEQSESDFLSLLDGEMQIDNVVYLATTNYLDRIPPRFKNRPSRFASIIEVGLPDAATRKIYLNNKIDADENIDIDQWVNDTEGFTIDHLKDLIISVLCLDLPFNEAIDRLKGFRYDEEKADEQLSNRRSKMFSRIMGIRDDNY